MAARVSIWFSIVVLFLIAPSIRGEESESKEFVLTLDHSNFTDTVSKHNFIVVEFYAPWCGHCKSLAPEYEKAASMLSSHDPPIVLAKIDANEDSNKELATKFEIQGFPTLKIVRDGGKSIQEYDGPRDADGIVAYLKKQSGPASAEIKSTEEANNLIGDKDVVVVGIFPKFSGEEYENFMALAEKLRSEYVFGHTSDAKYLPRGDLSVTGPVVRLFKPFDELFVDFKDFKVDALDKFVQQSSVPLVTIFDSDVSNHPYVRKFFNSPNTKAMMFVNFTDEGADMLKSKYREVAESYKGEGGLSFLVGDVGNSQGAFQYFGVQESQAPLIIIQTNEGQKYLKANLEANQIATWVKDFTDGKVPEYRKSEPIPLENNEPVKVVVADSFQDMVSTSGKNVLIEFYAPWCGHCQKLAPILDEVAVSYQADPDVVIAKLDATANDYPTGIFDVKGFPTMYFRSASGTLTLYEGDRTKQDIIDFIEKNRDKKSHEEEPAQKEPALKEPAHEEPAKDEL